ncbi:hypothetical protein FNF31_03817 [Cafeteria roenbergensis]|uniref:Kinesin motor domain-containing protein n=1 Tax=Cafeteria roenbergensis TaxID=33653 RepID=A0A5A8D9U6_CAFRO|nr:hypothetical protein FNF31_03817 [Cafeteria roenbergensis]
MAAADSSHGASASPATPSKESRDNIKVICRFRPLNARERREQGDDRCAVYGEAGTAVSLHTADQASHTFRFDKVFDEASTQEQVYAAAGRPVIAAALEGFNSCLLAYGQTGSGKTFTMTGADATVSSDADGVPLESPGPATPARADSDGEGGGAPPAADMGVIPRVARDLFEYAMDADETVEFSISVSMVEIYMEKIRCLLDPSKANLQVGEDPSKGVYLKEVTEVDVVDEDELLRVLRAGNANRAVAATGMNAGSSRSHSLFMLHLVKRDSARGESRSSRLYLVDLAGSETVNKTGVSGQQLQEAMKINQSLSALGNVIKALTDGKATHVPYRNSKLTRVLQECLGGNARTALVICCSPSIFNQAETLSTLRFGKRAKQIRNRATVNRERSPDQMRRYIAQLEAELAAYRAADGGESVPRLLGDAAAGDAAAGAEAAAGAAAVVAASEGGVAAETASAAGDEDAAAATTADAAATAAALAAAEATARDSAAAVADLKSRNEKLAANVRQLSGLLGEAATELSGMRDRMSAADAALATAKEERSNVAAERDRLLAQLRDADAAAADAKAKAAAAEAAAAEAAAAEAAAPAAADDAATDDAADSAATGAADDDKSSPEQSADEAAAAAAAAAAQQTAVDEAAAAAAAAATAEATAAATAAAEAAAATESSLRRELELLRATFQRTLEDNESLREQLRDAEMSAAQAEAADTAASPQATAGPPSAATASSPSSGDAASEPAASDGGRGRSAATAAASPGGSTDGSAGEHAPSQRWEVVFQRQAFASSSGWKPAQDEDGETAEWASPDGTPLPGGTDDVALPGEEWYWLGQWHVAHDFGQAALRSGSAEPEGGAAGAMPVTDADGWRYGETLDEVALPRSEPPRSVHGFRDRFRRRAWVRCRAALHITSLSDAASQVRSLSAALRTRDAEVAALTDQLEESRTTVHAYEGRLSALLSRMADAVAADDIDLLQSSRPLPSGAGAATALHRGGSGRRVVRGGGGRRRKAEGEGGRTPAITAAVGAVSSPASGGGGGGSGGGGFFGAIFRGLSRRLSPSPYKDGAAPVHTSHSSAGARGSPLRAGGGAVAASLAAAAPAPGAAPGHRPSASVPHGSSLAAAARTGAAPAAGAATPLVFSQLQRACELGDVSLLRRQLGLSPQAAAAASQLAEEAFGEANSESPTALSGETAPGKPLTLQPLPPVPPTAVVVASTGAEGTVSRRGETAAGLSVDATDGHGRHAAHYAAKSCSVVSLEALRQAGANVVGASDADGRQAIHVAARAGAMGAVVWLLRAGASPSALSKHCLTPLHEAVLGRAAGVARLLVRAGADASLRDSNGFTAADLCRRRARPGDAAWEATMRAVDSAAAPEHGTEAAAAAGDDRAPASAAGGAPAAEGRERKSSEVRFPGRTA